MSNEKKRKEKKRKEKKRKEKKVECQKRIFEHYFETSVNIPIILNFSLLCSIKL